jgi:hypothetical protein
MKRIEIKIFDSEYNKEYPMETLNLNCNDGESVIDCAKRFLGGDETQRVFFNNKKENEK